MTQADPDDDPPRLMPDLKDMDVDDLDWAAECAASLREHTPRWSERGPQALRDAPAFLMGEHRLFGHRLLYLADWYFRNENRRQVVESLERSIVDEICRVHDNGWDVMAIVQWAIREYCARLGIKDTELRALPSVEPEPADDAVDTSDAPPPPRAPRGPDKAPRKRKVLPAKPKAPPMDRRLRRLHERQRAILDLLRRSPGLSENAMRERLRIGRAQFTQAFDPLKREPSPFVQMRGTLSNPSWHVVRSGYPTLPKQKTHNR